MNYKVEALPDEPIVLITLSKQYSGVEDGDISGFRATLDEASEPMFLGHTRFLFTASGRSEYPTLYTPVRGAY